jgi:hypothetical protein
LAAAVPSTNSEPTLRRLLLMSGKVECSASSPASVSATISNQSVCHCGQSQIFDAIKSPLVATFVNSVQRCRWGSCIVEKFEEILKLSSNSMVMIVTNKFQ